MKQGCISIVIVNYNGRTLLKVILDSIKQSSFRNYEIIVVDNNSRDDSINFVKRNYKNAKIIKNDKNLGYVGINSALPYCKGDYILFLNNDIKIDKNCIGNMVKSIKSDKNIAMVAPKLINFYDKNIVSGGTWVSRAFYNGHIRSNSNNIPREIPYLGVGLIRKEFADMFGYLFDPDYFIYAEDLDLGLRIRLNGKKIIFEPDAIMHHMHSVTMQKTSKTYTTFLMERNLLTTFLKILSMKNIILCLPYALFARFIAILRDIAIFRIDSAFSRVKAIFYVLFNLNSILNKRKETQKFRKADDSYILKIFSEKYLFRPKFIV